MRNDDTQDGSRVGLVGICCRKFKVSLIGAGSFFAVPLTNDILRIPGNWGGEIALIDIDPKRLATIVPVVERMAEAISPGKWKVVAGPDRGKLIAGSDYVINCIEVAGMKCVNMDHSIPAEFGVFQCVGDTIGPAGIFKALRTVPVWLEILRDIERLCPKALVLNYSNPMNILCVVAARSSPVRVLGLCHSVQSTSTFLASEYYADVPYDELEWECAGINHLAWFVTLRHRGKDLYPKLMRQARELLARVKTDPGDEHDLVRKDVMLHFGAFVTESSSHLSEYLPYYRKAERTLTRYCRESHAYPKFWPKKRKLQDRSRLAMLKGKQPLPGSRSWEYASWIIEAIEKNTPFVFHGNVMNSVEGDGRLITNLPANGCVEVACVADGNGVRPTRFGALPPQMAALCTSNMQVFDLAADASIHRSKQAAIHALMLDPLTAAVCCPAEIAKMVEKLFRAQKNYLPKFQ